ncbi:MAG: hypothetical protein II014_02475, partial [Bifidobacteriaceae bacterium]|nr:hypothetical protein [Bifidobacteriaceae bacterium]
YHRQVGKAVRDADGSLIVVCQDESKDSLAKGYTDEVAGSKLVRSLEEAREEAERKVKGSGKTLVVLKGSHAFHLDSLAQNLEKGI